MPGFEVAALLWMKVDAARPAYLRISRRCSFTRPFYSRLERSSSGWGNARAVAPLALRDWNRLCEGPVSGHIPHRDSGPLPALGRHFPIERVPPEFACGVERDRLPVRF